ncbi:MAG: hypothetical protein ACRET6_03345 [Burkholderiales bacterium]
MTADQQPQKLTEESCADFVDRIQLEALNRRWATVVFGRHGRNRQDSGKKEMRPTPMARPDQETRSVQAD